MKKVKIIVATVISICIIFASIKISKDYIEKINDEYIPKNSVNKEAMDKERIKEGKETVEAESYPHDVDKMISRYIGDGKAETLPIKYEKNFALYKNSLYITNNKGQNWMKVLNDNDVGYAKVNDYLESISESNIYVSKDKVAVIYGGRGSENISIISADISSNTYGWSVGTISKTATHNLKSGYDKLYVDFVDNGLKGYIIAIKHKDTPEESKSIYDSVNSGVTWCEVKDTSKEEYNEILKHFGL